MDHIKRVSVIIPTYNRAYCIRDAIESVLCQTYPIFEVIVIDDGSTDNTEEIVKSIADNRVRLYRTEGNRGAGAARNLGVKMAQGNYIAFHDSDDICYEERIAWEMKKYDELPQAGLIYGSFFSKKSETEGSIFPDYRKMLELEGKLYEKLLIANTIDCPTILMRKDVFNEVGGFDESMSSLEDWDLVIRVSKKYSIGYIPKAMIITEFHPDGLSANVSKYFQNRCYMLRKYLSDYMALGLLNRVLIDIIKKAKQSGVLPQVEKMIELYLGGK